MKRINCLYARTGFLLIIFFSCSQPKNPNQKYWMGRVVDFTNLSEQTNTYHMFDSTNEKVGSMIFGWKFRNGTLVARDTSQFDNGSVYETAEMIMDTSKFLLQSLAMQMKMGTTNLTIDLKKENDKISGLYKVKRDTIESVTQVDSAYFHDVFREEIYMVLHSLDLGERDTVELKPFLSAGLTTTKARIFLSGSETVVVQAGTYKCDIVWLKSEGGMPTNKIWISQNTPKQIIKFYVPGPELHIELIESRNSTF